MMFILIKLFFQISNSGKGAQNKLYCPFFLWTHWHRLKNEIVMPAFKRKYHCTFNNPLGILHLFCIFSINTKILIKEDKMSSISWGIKAASDVPISCKVIMVTTEFMIMWSWTNVYEHWLQQISWFQKMFSRM